MNELAKILTGVADEMATREEHANYTAEEIKELGSLYLQKHEFRLGDLVMWKPGMKNGKRPEYGQPVVIVDIQPGLRSEAKDMGTDQCYALCDICAGTKMPNGKFAAFWFDSNRMQPYTE